MGGQCSLAGLSRGDTDPQRGTLRSLAGGGGVGKSGRSTVLFAISFKDAG